MKHIMETGERALCGVKPRGAQGASCPKCAAAQRAAGPTPAPALPLSACLVCGLVLGRFEDQAGARGGACAYCADKLDLQSGDRLELIAEFQRPDTWTSLCRAASKLGVAVGPSRMLGKARMVSDLRERLA